MSNPSVAHWGFRWVVTCRLAAWPGRALTAVDRRSASGRNNAFMRALPAPPTRPANSSPRALILCRTTRTDNQFNWQPAYAGPPLTRPAGERPRRALAAAAGRLLRPEAVECAIDDSVGWRRFGSPLPVGAYVQSGGAGADRGRASQAREAANLSFRLSLLSLSADFIGIYTRAC